MNQFISRWAGLLRKKKPVRAPLAAVPETPPDPTVALLWTGPGLGAVGTDGV